MTIDPIKEAGTRGLHDLLLGAVAPRPIALASTVDAQGHVNLSPFSFFNIFSTNPVILVFSPSRRARDRTTKHTLENILETREVVINTVSRAMAEQVSLASSEYPREVNEFEKAGFTAIRSEQVRPPRVKESPVSFECRVQEVKVLGTEGGSGNLVICEVVRMHVQDSLLDPAGKIDPLKADYVARMGDDYYCHVHAGSIFKLPKPGQPVGIGIDQLPPEIRNSPVLSGSNLAQLAGVSHPPSPIEAAEFATQFSGDLAVRGSHAERLAARHRYAQTLLDKGDIKTAWLVLMIPVT